MTDTAPNGPAEQFLDAIGATKHRKLLGEMLSAVAALSQDEADTLDIKIVAAALTEMREAFEMFQPYRNRPKVTVFGSARTKADDPLYVQACEVARLLAERDWMVVTGAGPGIMQAAMEGAGREHSIGVAIRLPFEQSANSVIAGDEKYVSMKYFFTRKLMLVKESKGFICLPGGFGTLDETFELLTLTQTGKGAPTPIVFLDTPGDPFWESFRDVIQSQLVARGLVSPADMDLFLITDSCEQAVDEVCRFYANYDSMRYVGDRLVIRMRHELTEPQLAALNDTFGHLCTTGVIEKVTTSSLERRENDVVDLHRVAFTFAKHGYGDLRNMIDAINEAVNDDIDGAANGATR
jgi:uncharacterized protein (TIGR00730 family)